MFKQALFIVFIGILLSCNFSKKKEEKTATQKTKPIKKVRDTVINGDTILFEQKKYPVYKYKKVYKKPKKTLVKEEITTETSKDFFLQYAKENPETKVVIKTRLGDLYITLYKHTPIHRASFIYLTKNGYWNTTVFHRVVKDFIIQAGNSELNETAQYRNELNHYLLPPEFNKIAKHKRGSISACREWVKNPNKLSDPFEFYITQTNVDCSHLNFQHTVFGEVTKGFSVIDKICNLEITESNEWPVHEVPIKVEILD